MKKTLLITLRAGGTIEIAPEEGQTVRYEVEDKALVLRRRDNSYTDFYTFRIIADGVWADVEIIFEPEEDDE